jgi:hypothetical protein
MDKTIIKECPRHGLTEHVLQTNGSYRCKECRKDAVIDIRRRNKIKLVEYKGGKCERCGYDKCIDALEFHHLNSDEKDFGLSCGDTRSFEKLKVEVDKCVMVCANCHREIHAEERKRKILERDKKKIENEIAFFKEHELSKEQHQSKSLIREKLEIEKIKDDINNSLPKTKMAEKYGVGLTTLRRFLKRNNVDYVEGTKNVTGSLSKNEFICSFKKLKTFTKVGELFGVSDNALRKWCERNGLPWRKKELVEYIKSIK